MAPTCFPHQMTLRRSRQARLCRLLSRPSGACGPPCPLPDPASERVWSTDISCRVLGPGLRWLRARRLRAMAQKAQTLSRRWMRQSRAPPLQTRCRAAIPRGTFCRCGWPASRRLLESWRCGRARVSPHDGSMPTSPLWSCSPQVALHCIQKLIAYGYVRGKIVMVGNVKKWLVDVVMDTVMLRPPRAPAARLLPALLWGSVRPRLSLLTPARADLQLQGPGG